MLAKWKASETSAGSAFPLESRQRNNETGSADVARSPGRKGEKDRHCASTPSTGACLCQARGNRPRHSGAASSNSTGGRGAPGAGRSARQTGGAPSRRTLRRNPLARRSNVLGPCGGNVHCEKLPSDDRTIAPVPMPPSGTPVATSGARRPAIFERGTA